MIRERFEGPIKVTFDDEQGTSYKKATITVDEGRERLSLVIYATIEHKPGADGGLYPCVVFKKVEAT